MHEVPSTTPAPTARGGQGVGDPGTATTPRVPPDPRADVRTRDLRNGWEPFHPRLRATDGDGAADPRRYQWRTTNTDPRGRAMTTWLGLDAGHDDPATADATAVSLYESLLFHAHLVCVHVVEDHHAMSFRLTDPPSENTVSTLIERGYGVAVHNGSLQRLAGPESLARSALRAALAHRDRKEGRALRFPGQRSLRGRYGVSDILAFSAIEEVVPHHVTSVDARGDLQPTFVNGRLVLDCHR